MRAFEILYYTTTHISSVANIYFWGGNYCCHFNIIWCFLYMTTVRKYTGSTPTWVLQPHSLFCMKMCTNKIYNKTRSSKYHFLLYILGMYVFSTHTPSTYVISFIRFPVLCGSKHRLFQAIWLIFGFYDKPLKKHKLF